MFSDRLQLVCKNTCVVLPFFHRIEITCFYIHTYIHALHRNHIMTTHTIDIFSTCGGGRLSRTFPACLQQHSMMKKDDYVAFIDELQMLDRLKLWAGIGLLTTVIGLLVLFAVAGSQWASLDTDVDDPFLTPPMLGLVVMIVLAFVALLVAQCRINNRVRMLCEEWSEKVPGVTFTYRVEYHFSHYLSDYTHTHQGGRHGGTTTTTRTYQSSSYWTHHIDIEVCGGGGGDDAEAVSNNKSGAPAVPVARAIPVATTSSGSACHGSGVVADRLRELENARPLLSPVEYERKRAEILASL